MPGPIVVADTSVVINFLKIDRMDLIGSYPHRFLVTDHVAAEITGSYPDQKARFEAAVGLGYLDICAVEAAAEVDLFTQLAPGRRLGAGECAAIAVAITRQFSLAIDDNRAVKRTLREAGLASVPLQILRTQDIILALIKAKILDVQEADEIKESWARQHRFALKIRSFADLV